MGQTAGGQSHNRSQDKLFSLGSAALCALEVFVLSLLFSFPLTCLHPADVKVRKMESFKASLRPNFFFSFLAPRYNSAMSGVVGGPCLLRRGQPQTSENRFLTVDVEGTKASQ